MDRVADPVIEEVLRTVVPRLVALLDPKLILAFGSRARGDAIAESDLDLLIVSQRFASIPFLARAFSVLEAVEFPVAVDLLCYTPEELEQKRAELGTVSAALDEGLVLQISE